MEWSQTPATDAMLGVVVRRARFAGLTAVIVATAWAGVARSGEPPAAKAAESSRIKDFQFNGERWTCKADDQPLEGILLRPTGTGPFPAIIISHGLGGNAQMMMRTRGRELQQQGFVCIATDYTHAATGRPPQGRGAGQGRFQGIAGDSSQFGAKPENIRRAIACVEILRQQPDVDRKRIAAYGHSMGAFLTIALAAAIPDRLAAAAITAGGVAPPGRAMAAPTTEAAEKIRTPMLILHGTADTTVVPEHSERLKQILDKNRVPNDRRLFEGVGHNLPNEQSAEVGRLMRGWFERYGVLSLPGR